MRCSSAWQGSSWLSLHAGLHSSVSEEVVDVGRKLPIFLSVTDGELWKLQRAKSVVKLRGKL